MTHPNPKDPQADIREAISLVVVKWISELPDETTELVNIKHDEWQQLYAELVSLFVLRDAEATVQLRKDNAFIKALKRDVQQALLSELLGEAEELLSAAYTTEKGYIEVDTTSGNPIEVPAVPVSVIEKYREGL